ncbi:glucose 1-dehydrogenase [Mycobacterium sp. 1274756.6]|uniref:SDR family NAD(P)-dependent oxidoreductase n=1 Tax=Mycobacterium sp. 1274756.6 TaxID=1834076 RepID=UPI0007FBC6D9|nr:glucose 1-dehydrogenase [Mycobacterium sp. 1274756.6]OBJ67482.1 short-chain dehydrogenase [Mycobacterium sp. 1274756.6]
MRFHGKTAFVTGGAAGLGREFARALTDAGAAVAIADIDAAAARRTAEELNDDGGRVWAVPCDVADEQQVDAAIVGTVERFGGVDILVNNAGLHLLRYNQPFGVLSRADVRALFDVNVIGVVNCTLACREPMRARGGGVVVNLASVAGYLNVTPYGVSKLAVRGLTVAFATELAADRIRVNAIAPGLTDTANTLDDLPSSLVQHIVAERQLVHRLGTAGDVVAALLFLCSEEASFITGETLRVSGGYPLGL